MDKMNWREIRDFMESKSEDIILHINLEQAIKTDETEAEGYKNE